MFQKQESQYIWAKTDYGKNLEERLYFAWNMYWNWGAGDLMDFIIYCFKHLSSKDCGIFHVI